LCSTAHEGLPALDPEEGGGGGGGAGAAGTLRAAATAIAADLLARVTRAAFAPARAAAAAAATDGGAGTEGGVEAGYGGDDDGSGDDDDSDDGGGDDLYEGEPWYISLTNLACRIVNGRHEYVGVKFTSAVRAVIDKFGGGISGRICAKGVRRVVMAMDMGPDSVFADVGSGAGHAVFIAACLAIKLAYGFDIEPPQVTESIQNLGLLQTAGLTTATRLLAMARVVLFQADVLRVASLAPATHVYAFFGYTAIILATALRVALSPTVRIFAAVVLHREDLEAAGLLLAEDGPVRVMRGMFMPGGNRCAKRSSSRDCRMLTPRCARARSGTRRTSSR
jgi:hypothetical protein